MDRLNEIVKESGERIEGNCFYQHHSDFKLRKDTENLRQDLIDLGSKAGSILEIGTNAGHSLFLMNTKKSENGIIVGVDKCFHKYTQPCMDYFSTISKCPFEFYAGKSENIYPALINKFPEHFNLIHIDGGHSTRVLENDITKCFHLSHTNTLVLIDDTTHSNIKKVCDKYISTGFLIEQEEVLLDNKKHRLFKYNKS